MKKPDSLKKIKRIHFTGIKGVGMTALACCAQDLGIKVSGSDVEETFVTDEILDKRGIKWQPGFSPEKIGQPDLLIATGAHQGFDNPEVKEAVRRNIRAVSYAQALAMFMEGKKALSVCGVGGKTTTSSMMATVLENLGFKPSFAVGVGKIFPLGDPGRMANGKYFVAEADEYAILPGIDNRPKFFLQKPKIIVVTNILYDHPDIYKNIEETKKAFKKFFETLPNDGILIACIDNQNVSGLISEGLGVNVQTYGFSPRADWRITKIAFAPEKTFFDLSHRGVKFKDITLSVPGRFNALNAAAAFAVANFLGGDSHKIISGLKKFAGSRRRFEFIGGEKGIKLYDDYAHHPSEIKATLKAAKAWFPGSKIVTVFQPHTFSRTQALFTEFSRAFTDSDQVLISDIYASAREKPIDGVSARVLAMETKKYKRKTFYCPGKESVLAYLEDNLIGGEIVLTLGAGDIFLWQNEIMEVIKRIERA